MPFSIPLTGLAANDPVPGNYLEINFAQGNASLGTATYPALLIGNRTTVGTATVDTVVYGPNAQSPLPLSTVQDAINLFGQGSELHRMFRRFVKVNQVTPVYAIAVAESAGANATLAITLATTATANGTLRIYVNDEFVDVAITNGDTPTVIGGTASTGAQAAINSKLDWPVTAVNAAGVLTLTAKQKGLRGNQLKGRAVVLGSGVGTTSSVTTQTAFSSGTTADSSTNALATILPNKYYYLVSAAEDAAQLGALSTQVSSQALPVTNIRQRIIAGSQDTSTTAAAVVTIANGLNQARAEIFWQQSSDWTPAELAANMAGIIALEETPLAFRCNYAGYGSDAVTSTRWFVPFASSATSGPTRSTIRSCLNNGVSPIGTNTNGTTYLVNRVTTRSLSGATPDYRIRDSHKVTICDRFGDDWLAVCSAQFSGKKIGNDPVKGQRPPGNDVVTPRVIRGSLLKLIENYNDLGLLQNVDDIKAQSYVIREASPTTRASVKVPLQTVDGLFQIATSIDQIA